MSEEITASQKMKTGRIDSIDIIRGFTILVMIFVNDLAGVANVPAWMKHAPTMHDGMTFRGLGLPGVLVYRGYVDSFFNRTEN